MTPGCSHFSKEAADLQDTSKKNIAMLLNLHAVLEPGFAGTVGFAKELLVDTNGAGDVRRGSLARARSPSCRVLSWSSRAAPARRPSSAASSATLRRASRSHSASRPGTTRRA